MSMLDLVAQFLVQLLSTLLLVTATSVAPMRSDTPQEIYGDPYPVDEQKAS